MLLLQKNKNGLTTRFNLNSWRQSRFEFLIFFIQELNERRFSFDVHHATFVQHTSPEYKTIIAANLRDWHWLTAGRGKCVWTII